MRDVLTIENLEVVSRQLLEAAGPEKVWVFHGEMGAGKTTLIKEICKVLGVHSVMTSPTFSIVNEYSGNGKVFYHFDFYRLKGEEEAYDIGVEEYLDSGNYCFIEWPERIVSLLPQQRFNIYIEIDGSDRRIRFQRYE